MYVWIDMNDDTIVQKNIYVDQNNEQYIRVQTLVVDEMSS